MKTLSVSDQIQRWVYDADPDLQPHSSHPPSSSHVTFSFSDVVTHHLLAGPPLFPPSYPLQQPQPQPPSTRILPLASSGRACPLSSVTSVSSYSILLSSRSHLTLISSQLQRVRVSMQYVFITLSTAPPDVPCPIVSTPPTYSPLCHLMLHRLASSLATASSDGKSLPHTRHHLCHQRAVLIC